MYVCTKSCVSCSPQVGFGKGTPSKQLWIDGIDPVMSEAQLERQLAKYGRVRTMPRREGTKGEGSGGS